MGPPGDCGDHSGDGNGGGGGGGRSGLPGGHSSDRGGKGPRGPARRRLSDTSDEENYKPREKEGGEVEITALPSTEVHYEAWWARVVDLITTCARGPNEAMTWVMRMMRKGAKFQEFGANLPNMMSLDAKIRSAISKQRASGDATKHTKLVTEIKRHLEECCITTLVA